MSSTPSADRASWLTAGATLLSYGLVLLVLFLLLFALPYVVYSQGL